MMNKFHLLIMNDLKIAWEGDNHGCNKSYNHYPTTYLSKFLT